MPFTFYVLYAVFGLLGIAATEAPQMMLSGANPSKILLVLGFLSAAIATIGGLGLPIYLWYANGFWTAAACFGTALGTGVLSGLLDTILFNGHPLRKFYYSTIAIFATPLFAVLVIRSL